MSGTDPTDVAPAGPVVQLKTLEEVSQHFEDYSEPAFARCGAVHE